MRFWLLLVFIFSADLIRAQDQTTPVSDSVQVKRWVFVSYDNDAHFKSDYYYTQGVRAAYYSEMLQNKGITKILLNWPGSQSRTGFIIVNDAFTPIEIEPTEIQYGDRPFAGYVYLGIIRRAVKPEQGLLFTSEFDVGVMGPWSGAKPVQTRLHTWLQNAIPHGWKNQIAHDVVLNYNLQLEKRLLEKKNIAGLYAVSGLRAGTLYSDLSGGFTVCLGSTEAFRNNAYVPNQISRNAYRKLQVYFQASAIGKLVGYNATMQGGIFNEKNCVYTLEAPDIDRLVGRGGVGVGVTYRGTMLEYDLFRETPEFNGGKWHNFSRIRGGIRF